MVLSALRQDLSVFSTTYILHVTGGASAEILVRRHTDGCPCMEVRVAVIGNVDSGKSTLVGVLTRGMLDDGRGLARSKARSLQAMRTLKTRDLLPC